MKNILLPTDFSENSWNATKYALQLFKDQECIFHFLNVYTPVIYDIGYFEIGAAQVGMTDALKKVAEEKMAKLLDKVAENYKNPNHTFSSIVSFNTLPNEINELYEANVVDFVVMGTKGASGLEKVLFGTNAVQVIKNAECPVLTIPSNYVFENLDQILFPSDYEADFQKLDTQYLAELAAEHKAIINFLHVSQDNHLTKEQKSNKEALKKILENIDIDFNTEKNKHVAEGISNFQMKRHFDLLVMVNNKKSLFEKLFFSSKINQIGFQINIPFLVIPA